MSAKAPFSNRARDPSCRCAARSAYGRPWAKGQCSVWERPAGNPPSAVSRRGPQYRPAPNSAGKSSLIEIIHFLLGSRADANSLLRNPALIQFTFRCTIRINGIELTVARSGSDPSKVLIDEQAAVRVGLKPRTQKEIGLHYIPNETWKEFLGNKMFSLPSQIKGSLYEESYTPTEWRTIWFSL
jgi:hypothetical protein